MSGNSFLDKEKSGFATDPLFLIVIILERVHPTFRG